MDPELRETLRDLKDEINRRLDRIERLLLGDGQEGLIREVALATEFRERFEGRYRLILGAAIGALFSAVASLVRTLLR